VGLGIGRVGSYAAHGSGEIVVGFSTANIIPRRTQKMVYKLKILLDQRLDPLYEAVMEATEEAILNSMCMAEPMKGVNDNYCPALPLDEVRRFVDACRPIFASVKKRPQQSSAPASREKPQDADKEGEVRLAEALPTAVRGAEGIPYPTRPAPDEADSSAPGGSSDT
jgi:D-aminopeptidase